MDASGDLVREGWSMVGDALSLKSRPVSASNGHWRGPFFAERRKGPLAAGHLPGNPPRTSQDRDPGGHIWGKSPQPAPIEGGTIFPDGRERNICHFMDGNRLCANPVPRFGGELATNEPYAHFEADGRPSDGAGSGMNPRRDGHGAGPPPPRTGVAPGLATQNWTAPRGTALPL